MRRWKSVSKKTAIFKNTFYIGEVQEYSPKNFIDYWKNQHIENAEMIEKQLPISFFDYQTICIFHDDIWASRYCKDKKISYTLVEDALDIFKTLSTSPFAYMLPEWSIKNVIKKVFGIGYVFNGLDVNTKHIEVNNRNITEAASSVRKKFIEVPREPLFKALTKEQTDILQKLFMQDTPNLNGNKLVLLLTQPLFEDRMVSTEQQQIEIYRNLVADYLSEGQTLVIKPHPRDLLDYSKKFPDAVIINKNMPVEVIRLCTDTKFEAVVTINSTAINSLITERKIM